MKPRVPWLRVFVEGVVIVGSILLAFGIDAWWQERQERTVEQDYLARLHSELLAGRDDIRNHHDRQVRTIAAMDTLLAMEADGRVLTGTELATTILNGGSYEVSPYTALFDQTYGEMLATGSLALIRDPVLRESITGYYRMAYQMASIVEESSSAGYRTWSNRVRSAMGTLPRRWFLVEPTSFQAARLALEPTTEQAARLVALIGPDTGWADEVRFTKSRVEAIDLELNELVNATDSLIEVLAGLAVLREPS